MLVKFEEYLLAQKISINRIKYYLRTVKEYRAWFYQTYGEEPRKFAEQTVEEYISFLQKERYQPEKTINHKLSILKKYNEFLVERGILSEIVINEKLRMKGEQMYASPAIAGEKEIIQLQQAISENGSKRDLALFNLLAYSGFRPSEVLAIKLEDCETYE